MPSLLPLPPSKSRRYTIVVFFNPVTPSRITISDICKSPQVRFLIVWSGHIYFPLSRPSVTNFMQLQSTYTLCLQYFQSEAHLMSNQTSTAGPVFAKIVNVLSQFFKLFSRKSSITNV